MNLFLFFTIFLISFTLISCSTNYTNQKEGRNMKNENHNYNLSGKKIIFIVAPANFRDEELFHTK